MKNVLGFASVAVLTMSFATIAVSADFRIDTDVSYDHTVITGQSGTRALVCYEEGTRETVAVSVSADVIFWLKLGSCAQVRADRNVGVSLSGNPNNGDWASGTVTRQFDF